LAAKEIKILLQPPAVQPEPAKEKGVSDATASKNNVLFNQRRNKKKKKS